MFWCQIEMTANIYLERETLLICGETYLIDGHILHAHVSYERFRFQIFIIFSFSVMGMQANALVLRQTIMVCIYLYVGMRVRCWDNTVELPCHVFRLYTYILSSVSLKWTLRQCPSLLEIIFALFATLIWIQTRFHATDVVSFARKLIWNNSSEETNYKASTTDVKKNWVKRTCEVEFCSFLTFWHVTWTTQRWANQQIRTTTGPRTKNKIITEFDVMQSTLKL